MGNVTEVAIALESEAHQSRRQGMAISVNGGSIISVADRVALCHAM